jgi:DNA-binding response OmpR family regulator/DNA-binding CsgD family transcriptional regulator
MNKPPLILVVDDSEDSLQLIGLMLQQLNAKISVATSGQDALAVLEDICPDLIILDIIMPNLDGFELCRKLKSTDKTENIPILFLSGKNSISDIVKGFKLGAMDYITKPVIEEELIARVKTQLAIKKHRDKLEKIVAERTNELIMTNKKLEDYNTALNVVLEKKDEYTNKIERHVLGNINGLCLPMIEKLRKTRLDSKQQQTVDVIEKNVKNMISPFVKNPDSDLLGYGLTQRELQVCQLIIQGRSSTEIADMLNSSESTVSFHRSNIRNKLNIKNKGVNLQIHLKKLCY